MKICTVLKIALFFTLTLTFSSSYNIPFFESGEAFAKESKKKLTRKEKKALKEQQKIEAEDRKRREALKAQMPPFSGLKRIVAVSRFDNKSSYGSHGWMAIGDGLADQLTDALMQSGAFIVLERQTIGDVIGEQDFATSGRVAKSQSARTGKITAAQILIKGTVTEFDINSAGGGKGLSVGGFRLGGSKSEAHIGLIIRLINSTTGEIIASERVEGKAKGSASAIGFNYSGVGLNSNSRVRTPIDKAAQLAIDRAVVKIANKLKNTRFRGRVVKVSQNNMYLSASERHGARIGDEFTVLSVGEEITDPFTGELLGRDEIEIGRVTITNVKERYSIARITGSFSSPAKVGDYITFNRRSMNQ